MIFQELKDKLRVLQHEIEVVCRDRSITAAGREVARTALHNVREIRRAVEGDAAIDAEDRRAVR